MSIESIPRSGHNHFNLLRIIAASAVIVSHSFPLSLGRSAVEPLQSFAGFSLGSAAVKAFFAISGYFILLSFERRRSNLAFIIARASRILPGLLAVSLIAAFIVGPLLTMLPGYFGYRATWLYPVHVVSLIDLGPPLPGVFATNPFPNVVNGSLWTLFFEVACYVGLFLTGVLTRRFWLVLAIYVPTYILCRYFLSIVLFATLSLPFLLGMAVYRYPLILKRDWAVGLLGIAVLSSMLGFRIEELWSLAIGYGVLWAGFAKADWLLHYNRFGDYSYGTYIYGFLIQQVIAASMQGIRPAAMMAFALPIAWVCGVLSWNLIEEPGLKLRRVHWRSPFRREPAPE